jgi:hypothetical protein
MTTTFSTTAEALAALAAVRAIVERLPVQADEQLHRILAPLHLLEAAIAAAQLVDPDGAKGTANYRRVHGLPPVEEGAT